MINCTCPECGSDVSAPHDHASMCSSWQPSPEMLAMSARIRARGALVEKPQPVGYFEPIELDPYPQGADSVRYVTATPPWTPY